jgi:hypothetical protein
VHRNTEPHKIAAYSSVLTWLIVEDPRAGKVARVNTLQAMGPPAHGVPLITRRSSCGSPLVSIGRCGAIRANCRSAKLAGAFFAAQPGRRRTLRNSGRGEA